MTTRCEMSGRLISEPVDGVFDDGEWISWGYINKVLDRQELQARFPNADPDVVEIFEDVCIADMRYHGITRRHLHLWGELGELFAEIVYGIKRHRPMREGSDGKLGNEFIEIKTISPAKRAPRVSVKKSGNFSRLVVVRIWDDYRFEARIIDRRSIKRGPGSTYRVHWDAMPVDPRATYALE